MKSGDVFVIHKMIKYCQDINLHAHDYERVDLEIVWNTLMYDIPDLRVKLERLLYHR